MIVPGSDLAVEDLVGDQAKGGTHRPGGDGVEGGAVVVVAVEDGGEPVGVGAAVAVAVEDGQGADPGP